MKLEAGKMSKLDKLKMPEKKSAVMVDELETADAAEGAEDELAAEEEVPVEGAQELTTLSDEELLAEIKKRGLLQKLQGEETEDENLI